MPNSLPGMFLNLDLQILTYLDPVVSCRPPFLELWYMIQKGPDNLILCKHTPLTHYRTTIVKWTDFQYLEVYCCCILISVGTIMSIHHQYQPMFPIFILYWYWQNLPKMPIITNRYLSSRMSCKWCTIWVFWMQLIKMKGHFIVVPRSLWLVEECLLPKYQYQPILRTKISVLVLSATCNTSTTLILIWHCQDL